MDKSVVMACQAYLFFMVVQAGIAGLIWWNTVERAPWPREQDEYTRRWAARFCLLSPIWPGLLVAAVVWAVIWVGRAMIVDAFRTGPARLVPPPLTPVTLLRPPRVTRPHTGLPPAVNGGEDGA